MNSYIERLVSLNEDGKFGQEFTGGGKIEITTQELLIAMAGDNRTYTDFIVNIVHKHPCTKETRLELIQDCIKAHKQNEQRTARLYKDRKKLEDDDCFSLANMAIDWMIQGHLDLKEADICKLASVYLTTNVNKSTWSKKYETPFLSMLVHLESVVMGICNRAKEKTGIYE